MIKRGKSSLGIGTKGVILILLLLLVLTGGHSGAMEVVAIEMGGEPGERIVTLRFTGAVNYRSFTLRNPPRVVLDMPGVVLREPLAMEVGNELVETISCRQHQPNIVRLVINLTQPAESRVRKVGRELRVYLSLPREMRDRLRTEERARQLFIQRVKRETELKAEKMASEKEEALRAARQEVEKQERMARQEAEARERMARQEAESRERQLRTYLSRGERHFRAQRFDAAIQEFEAALALDPGNEKAQNYLIRAREGKETRLLAQARVAQEEQEREEEERRQQERRRLGEERQQEVAEHLSRGRDYYRQGHYEEAISTGERVLALSPNNRRAEDLIFQSRRGALERDERRAREEREIVEGRRILDATKAPFTSPVDYFSAVAPERKQEMVDFVPEEEALEEVIDALREKAEDIMVTMDFRATDIREVLLHLAKLSEVTIALDEEALRGLADPDVTIFTPSPIPLTDALGIILRVKGLDYAIREHYIWVSEFGRVEGEAVPKMFFLRHKIRRQEEPAFRDNGDDGDVGVRQ